MKEIIKCFNNYYIQSLQKLQQPVILNLTKRWQHSHSISLNQPLGDLAQFKGLDGFCLSAVDQSHLLAVCETAWIWITQSRTWAPNPTEQNSSTAAQVTIVIVHLICLTSVWSYLTCCRWRLWCLSWPTGFSWSSWALWPSWSTRACRTTWTHRYSREKCCLKLVRHTGWQGTQRRSRRKRFTWNNRKARPGWCSGS